MNIAEQFLLEALVKHNYFPHQKKDKEEMPPIFSTDKFSSAIATEIGSLPSRKNEQYCGYDQLEFIGTRFNNVPRYFAIPHPKPHADLCLLICKNWNILQENIQSKSSLIRPKSHGDGRIIIMDYESGIEANYRDIKLSFGKRFVVKTDISSCFPSIYSHSIPWALVVLEEAKSKKSKRHMNEWFNELDKAIRNCKRNETQGVAVGPATSNIIVEIVLSAVDKKLAQKYKFNRFIDDYICYVKDYEDAEEFIRLLSSELREFNLHLSPSKTLISALPQPFNQEWITALRGRLPSSNKPNISELIGFLDFAVNIQSKNSEGSVLKYAAKVVAKKAKGIDRIVILRYLLSLTPHYPIILPVLNDLITNCYQDYGVNLTKEIEIVLVDRIINKCSDGMCWAMYYLLKYGENLNNDLADKIIQTNDCLAILSMSLFKNNKQKCIDFCNKLDTQDLYTLDKYWLLLYELYLTENIKNPYENDSTFDILKKNEVSFINQVKVIEANFNLLVPI